MSSADDPSWLRRFHAGEPRVLERCYRDHFARAFGAAARVLGDVDAETVTHEVFYRLLTDERTRRSFAGGDLGAFLARVAGNAAIDHHRRLRREISHDEAAPQEPPQARMDDEVEAKMLVARFRKEHLPERYERVFDARFIRQLPQRQAALELGMQRTTLAYQEDRIRALLRAFLIGEEAS